MHTFPRRSISEKDPQSAIDFADEQPSYVDGNDETEAHYITKPSSGLQGKK
jgi:hypothetical protein